MSNNPWDKYPDANPWDKYPDAEENTFVLSSIGDVVKNLGKGIVSGAKKSGVSLMRGGNQTGDFENPYVNMDLMEKNEAALKDYQEGLEKEEAEHRQKLSPSSRIANIAGDWLGSGLPYMGSPSGVGMKGLAKALKSDVATGTVSGALQETGIAEPLADILALLKGKTASGAKSVGKTTKNIFSSADERKAIRQRKIDEKERDVFFPALQETFESVFEKPVENNLKYLNFKKHSEFLNPKYVPSKDETGRKVIDALMDKFNLYKEARAEKTSPLYELALQSGVNVDPSNFRSSVAKLALDKGEDTQRKLLKIIKMVKNDKLTPTKIQSINEDLNDLVGQAKVRGEDNLARTLTQTKKMFDEKVFDQAPLLKEARAVYSDMSLPINKLEEHPLIPTAFKNITDDKGYSSIIAPALKSKKASQEIMEEIKSAPNGGDTLKSIRRQIGGEAMDAINEKGEVSLNKIAKFMRDNPGIAEFDPYFSKKMKNVSNIKLFKNEFLRKVAKQPVHEVLEEGTWKYLNKFKNIVKIPEQHIAGFTKLDKQLNKISDTRKKEFIDRLVNDKEYRKFMMTPIDRTKKYLYDNPLLFANIQRIINDLKE